jgi:hypothetical protein
MTTAVAATQRWLVRIDEMDHADERLTDVQKNAMRLVADWVRSFLSCPHQELGRPGDVCPYTGPAVQRQTFWLTCVDAKETDAAGLKAVVLAYRDRFLELPPRERQGAMFKTILMLFPDMEPADAPGQLDALQRSLKAEFVGQGLMVGQFYPGCPEPGLWNHQFRPQDSPVSLLAIRHIVPSDLAFLVGDRGNRNMILAYLARFTPELPAAVRKLLSEIVCP